MTREKRGSFIVDRLTDLVEKAVYKAFEIISARGGVLGAMDAIVGPGTAGQCSALLLRLA